MMKMAELSISRHPDGSVAVAQARPAPSLPATASRSGTLEDFTLLYDLASLISAGAVLASRCFDLGQPVHAELVSDQETGEQWVELVILARGGIREVRQARCQFTREWLRTYSRAATVAGIAEYRKKRGLR
jgi:hypothetical protein